MKALLSVAQYLNFLVLVYRIFNELQALISELLNQFPDKSSKIEVGRIQLDKMCPIYWRGLFHAGNYRLSTKISASVFNEAEIRAFKMRCR